MKVHLLIAVALAVPQLSIAADNRSKMEAGITHPPTAPMRDNTINRTSNDTRDVVKQTARQHIETSTITATGGHATPTSRDRNTGDLQSPAHNRGAVDFVTPKNSNADARAISKQVGPNHTTVLEQTYRHGEGRAGPEADRHTVYSNGSQVKSSMQPPRATGTHVHVQPNYEVKAPPRTDDSYKYRSSSGGGAKR